MDFMIGPSGVLRKLTPLLGFGLTVSTQGLRVVVSVTVGRMRVGSPKTVGTGVSVSVGNGEGVKVSVGMSVALACTMDVKVGIGVRVIVGVLLGAKVGGGSVNCSGKMGKIIVEINIKTPIPTASSPPEWAGV